jgi:Flp pilus assembly protein TadD
MDKFADKMAEGNAFARDHRFHEAEMAYCEAIQINPNEPSGHFNLAVSLSNLGVNPGEQESEFREAIRLDPSFSQAYKNLGKLMIEQDRFSEAERELHIAVDRNNLDPETRYLLGISLDEQNKDDEVVEEYRIAIYHEPNNIDAHFRLGILLGDFGRYPEAEHEFREVLRLNPTNSSAMFNLVITLQDQMMVPQEEKKLQEAVGAYPTDPSTHENLALFQDAIGKSKEARANWVKALELERRPHWTRFIKLRLKRVV